MEITLTVNVNAPGLEGAINNLAKSLASVAGCADFVQHSGAAVLNQVANVMEAPPLQPAPPTTPVTAAPTEQAPVTTSATAVPTAPQTYTMEQLAVAATQLVDAGRRNELVSLLTSFGVQALTALPKDQYGNFATQLRAMGAKI